MLDQKGLPCFRCCMLIVSWECKCRLKICPCLRLWLWTATSVWDMAISCCVMYREFAIMSVVRKRHIFCWTLQGCWHTWDTLNGNGYASASAFLYFSWEEWIFGSCWISSIITWSWGISVVQHLVKLYRVALALGVLSHFLCTWCKNMTVRDLKWLPCSRGPLLLLLTGEHCSLCWLL